MQYKSIFYFLLVISVAFFSLWILIFNNWFWLSASQADSESRSAVVNQHRLKVLTIPEVVKRGEYTLALQKYDLLTKSQEYLTYSEGRKARAFFNISGAFFKEKGDIESIKYVINKYKEIILNTEVPNQDRARVLNALATTYCGVGRDNRVLDVIYSGDVFKRYRVIGQPGLSSRRMLEASFKLYPTSKSAIGIAHWYAKELIGSHSVTMDEQKRKKYLEQSEHFLSQADALFANEITQIKRPPSVKQQASFRYWRAFTIAALALSGVEEYQSTYQSTYEDMISFIQEQNHQLTYDYLPPAHWMYAAFIMGIDKDVNETKKQLNRAIELVKEDPDYNSNTFILFIRNAKKRTQGDWLWQSIGDMQKISDEFDIFVKEILVE